MYLLAGCTKFQHLARYYNSSASRHCRQSLDRRHKRLRTGIVTIVEDRDVTQLDDLSTFIGRFERWQNGCDFGGHDTMLECDCSRYKHVVDIVRSQHRTAHGLSQFLLHEIEPPSRRPDE